MDGQMDERADGRMVVWVKISRLLMLTKLHFIACKANTFSLRSLNSCRHQTEINMCFKITLSPKKIQQFDSINKKTIKIDYSSSQQNVKLSCKTRVEWSMRLTMFACCWYKKFNIQQTKKYNEDYIVGVTEEDAGNRVRWRKKVYCGNS